MGVWLYGLIAGVSYAIQIRERGERERAPRPARGGGARRGAPRGAAQPVEPALSLQRAPHGRRPRPAGRGAGGERRREARRHPAAHAARRPRRNGLVPRGVGADGALPRVRAAALRGAADASRRNIDPSAFDCSTPSFALQTLVENAVRHSIASRVEGGTRRDHDARRWTGTFLLQVRDDGTGQPAPRPTRAGPGYGLRALKERLEAVYGDAASLAIRSEGGAGGRIRSLDRRCPATSGVARTGR